MQEKDGKMKRLKNLPVLWAILPVIGLLLFSSAAAIAQTPDIVVTTSVDRTQISQNQRFELKVEVSGKDANSAAEPELPDMGTFAVYRGSSSSQNIQIINGSMNVTKGYSYYYLAQKLGSFSIGPVTVKYKDQVFSSKPIEVEVVSDATSTPNQQGSGQAEPNAANAENLFLRAEVNKKRVYRNEPVIVDYRLYFRVQVTNYAFTSQPNYGDFWAEDFPGFEQPQVGTEVLNGVQYRVATIKKVALFPTSAGEKTIPAQGLEASVRVRERRGRRDIFDSFFDDPFFGRNIAQSVQSEPVAIEVLPFPEAGRPVDFSGAVGQFNMAAKVDRNAAKTNEAISLKLTISGAGNIKILEQPQLRFPDAFEVYDPKVSESVDRSNSRISGSKTYEFLLIPRRAGAYEIPAASFSYFDPQQQKYRTSTTKPITLTIEQGDKVASSVGSGFSKEEVKLIGEDIRYIEKVVGSFDIIGQKFYHLPLFWVALIAPMALFLTSFYYRSHQDRLSTNVAYARSRKAQKVAQKQLKEAKSAMTANDVARFYSECANALTKFVGNKLNVDDAALITDELVARLKQRHVSDQSIELYQKLLTECDFRRFASTGAPIEALPQFYTKVKDLLADLEKAL